MIKKLAENPTVIHGEALILQKKEIVVQLLSSEPKKTTMKYSKESPRVFVPYQYDEITLENIKEACKTFFHEHRPCDILASKMGPSCTRVDQIPHFKILYIRFIGFKIPSDDLSSISSRYVSKYSQSNYNPGPSKVPKYSHSKSASYSAVSHKRVGAKSQIPKFLSISHILKLRELQKKEKQAEGITIESFDVSKKEW